MKINFSDCCRSKSFCGRNCANLPLKVNFVNQNLRIAEKGLCSIQKSKKQAKSVKNFYVCEHVVPCSAKNIARYKN